MLHTHILLGELLLDLRKMHLRLDQDKVRPVVKSPKPRYQKRISGPAIINKN